jgi:hypothetical protein
VDATPLQETLSVGDIQPDDKSSHQRYAKKRATRTAQRLKTTGGAGGSGSLQGAFDFRSYENFQLVPRKSFSIIRPNKKLKRVKLNTLYGGAGSFGGFKTSAASKISDQFLSGKLQSSQSYNQLGSEKYREIVAKSRGSKRRKLKAPQSLK